MSTIARERHAAAIKVRLASLSRQRELLSTAQEVDNIALRCGKLDKANYMRRWAKRQQQRINLEARAFWLMVTLEEMEQRQ